MEELIKAIFIDWMIWCIFSLYVYISDMIRKANKEKMYWESMDKKRIESNVNASCKKINSMNENDERDETMRVVDQTLRRLQDNLKKVCNGIATVMADEEKAKQDLDECVAEIKKIKKIAKNALSSGDEDNARLLIAHKHKLDGIRQSLQQTYDVYHENTVKMCQMRDRLTQDIKDLEYRKYSVKAKVAAARAQECVNRIMSDVDSTSSIAALERMEMENNKALDVAMAESELIAGSSEDIDLVEKYTQKTKKKNGKSCTGRDENVMHQKQIPYIESEDRKKNETDRKTEEIVKN